MIRFFYILLALLLFNQAWGQSATTLTGTVSNHGKPVAFASVSLLRTRYGTITDETGRFRLRNVSAGSYTLRISAVGFMVVEKPVVIAIGQTLAMDVVLPERPTELQQVVVTGVRAITGMGYLAEVNDNVLYAGKKTEVLLLDSLNANTAQNNPRQVLGRVPGANYSETEGNGFPSNGIGFRGLNPTQSIETNTRQNGYNITADLYGYPESYYLPPLEAVERIEVTRGAASLAFGPQFGGVINYILRRGPTNRRLLVTTQQTGGSFGFFNSFNSAGGQVGRLNYYGFVQYQATQGWRPNAQFQKVSGYGRLAYQVSSRLTIGLEYSLLRNRLQMPGGLTDEQFWQDSRASYRARNWLTSPWNIGTVTADYRLSANTTISLKNTINISARDLVWRNEDGGPGAADSISTLTNAYVNREVQREAFRSNTTELRLLTNYSLGRNRHTIATGIRYFTGHMKRQGGGLGTTGSDFDLTLLDPRYSYALDYTTTNFAFFAENTFRVGNRLTLTPGLRYEYLNSTVKGYNPNADETGDVVSNRSKNRYIFLAGIAAQYKTSTTTNLYTNWSQAYRPLDYSTLTPFGTIATVNPNLKDGYGWNADFGFRGFLRNFLNFDLGLFYVYYNNRIGVIERQNADGTSTPYRTNVANSIHKGLESYLEINPIRALRPTAHWSLSVFNSLALIDARYGSGEFRGKQVEYAPKVINRSGLTVSAGRFSTTYLISYTGLSYGDAANSAVPSADAVAGPVPEYTVMDWSSTVKQGQYTVRFGINNVADRRYFTKRTDEYPGPGIIPSIGRSFYIGAGATF